MERYRIIVTPDAAADLIGLRSYYRIDETAKTVFILNVVYNRRDQLKVLAQMPIE